MAATPKGNSKTGRLQRHSDGHLYDHLVFGPGGENAFTEADGRQLAADLMRELHQRWLQADEELVGPDEDSDERMINVEPDILRRYLAKVRETNSPSLERGFLCVLSEFIGSALDGGIPDPDFYERRLEPRHG